MTSLLWDHAFLSTSPSHQQKTQSVIHRIFKCQETEDQGADLLQLVTKEERESKRWEEDVVIKKEKAKGIAILTNFNAIIYYMIANFDEKNWI